MKPDCGRSRGPQVQPSKFVPRSRGELRAFIRLPWRLYQGAANWVPPLISERKRHLSRKHNPFFEHAEAEYFLAWRGGQPVGRITAHVDHRFNEFKRNRWGQFGFFEVERDPGHGGSDRADREVLPHL